MVVGPVVNHPLNGSVMFYNGANNQAHWRIGWAEMDDDGTITNRCTAPLISPPKPEKDQTDIAFAAPAVVADDEIWVYYSIADQKVMRAVVAYED